MEKKKLFVAALLFVTMVITLYIKVVNNHDKEIKSNEDAMRFKEEYENLNDKKQSSEKLYKTIAVDEQNPMIYASYDDIKKVITDGTGVIYFGFPECPWCRNAVPVLLEAAKETGIDKIYYFNALSIRDKKHLDEDGNIIVDDEGTKEYKELLELLYDDLGEYEGLNDSSVKRLYFPTVVFIKNGEILGLHIGTVDSQTDSSVALTSAQTEELREIYSQYMLQVLGTMCDTEHEMKC